MKTIQKLAIFISIVLVGTTMLKAQDQTVLFGIKGGFNYSNFTADLKKGTTLDDTDSKIGFNVGATVDFAFSENIYLLTGLEFSTKGFTGIGMGQKINANAMYLNLPLQMGYKYQSDIDMPTFVFRFGPYVGYGIGGKTTLKSTDPEGEDTKSDTFSSDGLKKFDLGLGAAVGVELQKFTVDLGYNYGLLNISETPGKVNARNFFVNVGYKFKSE